MTQFYALSLNANGTLEATAASANVPADAADQLARFKQVFEQVRLRIPPSAKRTEYANRLLHNAKEALEHGDLASGKAFLDDFDEERLSIRYYVASVDQDGQLHLSPTEWIEDPTPPAVQVFVGRLENALSKVILLVQPEKRGSLYRILESHAQHGLGHGKLSDATIAVNNFEDRFVEHFGPIVRKRHLVKTLTAATAITVAALVLLFAAYWISPVLPEWLKPLAPGIPWVKTVAALAIGISLGVLFFAFMRNLALTFNTLGNFDPAQLSPWLRFTLVGVTAAILCILMTAGLIKIQINDLVLHNYATDIKAALIVGMLCGYSDAAITKLLTGVLDRK